MYAAPRLSQPRGCSRDEVHVPRAAVVARQVGKVCLVGCIELQIDESARTLTIEDSTLRERREDLLTLDDNQGAVYAGAAQKQTQCS